VTATKAKRPARAPRAPKKPTAARLENIALHHLGRFAATRTELTRVLKRRVERAIRADLIGREEALKLVEATVTKAAAAGYLDDTAIARAKATSMRQSGRSKRAITQKLATKGVSRDDAETAMTSVDGEDRNAELRAAAIFAARKKIGPYRNGKPDATTMKRDLAALARGGFSYAVARTVTEARSPETLAALLDD
jgi:regulatory protein